MALTLPTITLAWKAGSLPAPLPLCCPLIYPGLSHAPSNFLRQEDHEFYASLGSIKSLGQPWLCSETVSQAASTLSLLRLWGWVIVALYIAASLLDH